MNEQIDKEKIIKELAAFNAAAAIIIANRPLLDWESLTLEVNVLTDALSLGPTNIPLHEHPRYELSFMHIGEMKYVCDNRVITINPDNRRFFFMAPTVLHHRFTNSPLSVITGFQFHLHPVDDFGSNFIALLPQLLQKKGYCFESNENFASFLPLLRQEILLQRPFWREKAKLLLQLFLTSFFQHYFADELKIFKTSDQVNLNSRNTHLIETIKAVIEIHINRPCSLEDISSDMGISVRQLDRIFRKTMPMSLGQYIIQRKIESAKKMLQLDKMLVKDAAHALGYKDTSYFCRLFRKTTGCSPQQFAQSTQLSDHTENKIL
jgi:AraC-like DNA-binding protein